MKNIIDSYFHELRDALEEVQCTGPEEVALTRAKAYEITLQIAQDAAKRGNKVMFIGNGGSAGIASHMAIDFSKNGRMPALCFTDGAALTCLGNDYGYEEVFAQQLRYHARPGDVLFAISSSGSSPNILRAVAVAREAGCHVITMTGFRPDNPLRAMGDVNFHVGASEYGIVEVAHAALIHGVVNLKLACAAATSLRDAD